MAETDARDGKYVGLWEERFERRSGLWRGFYESAVHEYLDCGLLDSGFARVVCPNCHAEFFVAVSCKGRGLCPSCGAKRAALFSELLQNKILADIPHAQWECSIPKMLRPYFLYHRELLGDLARLAFETVRDMMVAAIDERGSRGTGRSVRISGYEEWTFSADGLIQLSQGHFDEAEYARQVGGDG